MEHILLGKDLSEHTYILNAEPLINLKRKNIFCFTSEQVYHNGGFDACSGK
jgi:hypothetical protein